MTHEDEKPADRAFEGAPESAPGGALESVPGGVPESVLGGASESMPGGVRESVLGDAPDSVPGGAPDAIPNDSPDSEPLTDQDVIVVPLEQSPVIMEGVVPLFLTATRAMAEQNPEAEKLAQAVVELLERNAEEFQESADGLWTAAAKVCRAVLIEHRPAMEMVEMAKELDRNDGYAWKTLCTMTYLGASTDIRTLPALAVNLQMAVAEYVCRGTHHMTDVYIHVVAPWFAAYWWRVFENAKFRFVMPRFVEMDLKDALQSDPDILVQRVLRVAATGLGMQLPERGREWFEVTQHAA